MSNAIKLVDEYGEETEAVIRSDPYRLLTHFFRLGFGHVDVIARHKLDISQYEPIRAAAALLVRLRQVETEGHCYDPRNWLLRAAQETMLLPTMAPGLTTEAAIAGLRLLQQEGKVRVSRDGGAQARVYYTPMLEVRVAWGQARGAGDGDGRLTTHTYSIRQLPAYIRVLVLIRKLKTETTNPTGGGGGGCCGAAEATAIPERRRAGAACG